MENIHRNLNELFLSGESNYNLGLARRAREEALIKISYVISRQTPRRLRG